MTTYGVARALHRRRPPSLRLQRPKPVRIARVLVPAQLADAREYHQGNFCLKLFARGCGVGQEKTVREDTESTAVRQPFLPILMVAAVQAAIKLGRS